VGFQSNFTGVISTITSCAHQRQVLLHCTKLLPELKIEKTCPVFTGQSTGGISTKLYRSDQNNPSCAHHGSASLQKIAARAKNRKILSGLHRLDFNETSPE
jgi:hypothetical protein